MLILISPAKTLDFESKVKTRTFTQPDFLRDSKMLVKEMQTRTAQDISEMMHVSSNIAELNFFRYLNFSTPFTPENARQAIYAFRGDVYTGIDIDSWKSADVRYAQDHLRILSGLYGVLRPLDLIQPYRLEMGIGLKNKKGDDLYAFWGDKITKAINEAIEGQRSKVLINLASQEYFKSVNTTKLEAELVSPVFKDYKNGNYKIISFFAKKARGQMSAWIIQNRVRKPEDLKSFDVDGYAYNPAMSTESLPVFTRKP